MYKTLETPKTTVNLSQYKLTGLGRLNSDEYMNGNIQIGKTEADFVKARIKGDDASKEALWQYCKGHWHTGIMAEVEHEGFKPDGTPINPIIVCIFYL